MISASTASTASTASKAVTCGNHGQKVAVDSRNADLLSTASTATAVLAVGNPPQCGTWWMIFGAPFLQLGGRFAVGAVLAVVNLPSARIGDESAS